MSNRSGNGIGVFAALVLGFLLALPSPCKARPLAPTETKIVESAIAAISLAKLGKLAKLANGLLSGGKISIADSDDKWLAADQSGGDTPFAYTLPDPAHPKQPIGMVLASRYLDATPRAQAALLIHELGHWQAFCRSGSSTEYDGYKLEYDTAQKIGLTDKDGLTYFAMLDGVVQFVVPRDPSYAKRPDIAEFMRN